MSNLLAYFKPLPTSSPQGATKNGTPRKRPRARIIDSESEEEDEAKKRPAIMSEEVDSSNVSDNRKVKNFTPKKQKSSKNFTPKKQKSSKNFTPKKQKSSVVNVGLTPKHSPHTLTPSTPLTPHSSKALAHSDASVFTYEKIEWLHEKKIRDKSGRLKNHPEYNPKTLLVPDKFLDKQTPAQRQWWEMKRTHFDTILMFKVGKFYELYHMDAVLGVQECGLVFMKGDMAHCGFPEMGFGKYSQMLVQKGYKVARVEQTESPAMMEERVKHLRKVSRFDRVVRREICSVATKGTQVPIYQDYGRRDVESVYLLAVKEEGSVYGVCFIDTSIGAFHLGQFEDDDQSSRLRTLCAHHPPAHVIYERGGVSVRTASLLKQGLASTYQEALAPKSEFLSSDKTLDALTDHLGHTHWPRVLEAMLDTESPGRKVARSEYSLAVCALGACVWVLKRGCVDSELLSLKHFEQYTPLDRLAPAESALFVGQRMILDNITLTNLDVVDNYGRPEGTLLQRIDHTVTAFGKRLLREWVCAPLCDPEAIKARQEAITGLVGHTSLVKEAKVILEKLPDLERKIRKFHMLGHPGEHPDQRALFYDHVSYSKQKIADFISVLEGFERAVSIVTVFQSQLSDLHSSLLRGLVSEQGNGGNFPSLTKQLTYFQTVFDKSEAVKAGVIVPSPGVNGSYDEALAGMKRGEEELADYLTEQKKTLGIKGLSFVTSGRNRYQLEVSEAKCCRLPSSYVLKSQRKGFKRYVTPELEEGIAALVSWEEKRDVALKDNMTCLFRSFDSHFEEWQTAVDCLSSLDALMSLAQYSSSSGMCRPEVVISDDQPFLDIRDGRHPCVDHTYLGDEFIPNDVLVDQHPCVVVTGPNMGGKSTLMRQSALIVILAQLGSYVPAESCRISPVDRVFTRIGASDRITAGESTFFVELKETAAILSHASKQSLVLMDELGRGTSTYDGTAIAWAVLTALSEEVQCRCFFSTHYHSLVGDLGHTHNVKTGHMSCLVESGDQRVESVTFLYKFVEGVCPRSYGFNVAGMAGIPEEVVQLARVKAAQFERTSAELQAFRKMFSITVAN